ncbi:hypothetical protein HUU42_12315, partial [bacterium]|nr:hypothetical protein [bacterium]
MRYRIVHSWFMILAGAVWFSASSVMADQGNTGGRYRWTDSDSLSPRIAPNWVSILDGTQIFLTDDDTSGFVDIGFSFTFFDTTISRLVISSNGFISFDSLTSSYPTRDSLQSSAPNNIIAAYWDSLAPAGVGISRVLYKTVGTAPHRQFVVTWMNFDKADQAGTQLLTFQIILYETTNMIRIQYEQLSGVAPASSGGRATVGIEEKNGNGLIYSFNSDSLKNNFAILFHTNNSTTANAQITPSSAITNTNLTSFVYRIQTTSPADSMSRFDSILIYNPFTDKTMTVTDIVVDGTSQFFSNSSTRPSDYGFATWSYNSATDTLSIRTAPLGIKDSITITFLLDVRDTLGVFTFPSHIVSPYISSARIAAGGGTARDITVVPDTLEYIVLRWADQSVAADTTIGADDSVRVLAYGYDRNDNFLRKVKVNWRVNGANGFLNADSLTIDSTTFHASTIGSGLVEADTAGFSDQTGLVTVVLGTDTSSVVIRTAPGGLGARWDTLAVTLPADSSLSLYAAGYDDDGNYIGDIFVYWDSVFVGTRGISNFNDTIAQNIVYTPTATGRGRIEVFYAGQNLRDTTGIITIVPGDTVEIRIVDDRGSGASAVGILSKTADDTVLVYAAAYDVKNNFIGNPAVNWSVSGGIGTLRETNLDSTILDISSVGNGAITATYGSFSDQTGLITVTHGDTNFIALRTAPNGGGERADTLTFNLRADSQLVIYGAAYDADSNLIGNAAIGFDSVWIGAGLAGFVADSGLSVTYNPTAPGSGRIEGHFRDVSKGITFRDTTGLINVSVGDTATLTVETQRDGNGVVYGPVVTDADSVVTLYAVLRDAEGNYIGTIPSSWSISGGIGDTVSVLTFDSARFAFNTVGSGQITARAGLFVGSSGVITVTPGIINSVVIRSDTLNQGIALGNLTMSVG